MATLQARFILVAFVALAAAITYNATFLQEGPHPAPMAIEPQRSERLPEKTTRTPREIARPWPGSKTIAAIQRKLAENGYEPGAADGVQGNMTRAAIMAYQHDNGLRVTGSASDQLLKNLILGASVVNAVPEGSQEVPNETKSLVMAVQLTLTKLGYDPGPADGLQGAATSRAIEEFERDRNLTVSGRISGRLVESLTQAQGGGLSIATSR